jgi:hypothetical protein
LKLWKYFYFLPQLFLRKKENTSYHKELFPLKEMFSKPISNIIGIFSTAILQGSDVEILLLFTAEFMEI